jgi:hypothetical protein
MIHKHKQEIAAAERKPENIPNIVQKYVDNNIGIVGLNDNVLGKHVAFISIAAGGGAGLCNEIMALAQGIFTAIDDNKKLIVVDSFNNQITWVGKSTHIPSKDVFDFDAMNVLLSKYNVSLIDKTELEYDIISATYGTLSSQVDITKEILSTYTFNGVLFIPKHTHLNVLRGDPEPNNSKIFTLKYSVNGIVYEDAFTENNGLESEICINVASVPFTYKFDWMTTQTRPRFNEFIKCTRFTKGYYDVADTYIDTSKDYKLNTIHVRNESDAISHWSTFNGVNKEDFAKILDAKYIHLIKTELSKETMIFVLTYDTDSNVIKYLRENGYKFMTSRKDQDGRELNAIVDLIIGSRTNGTFVGTYNPITTKGSSFSYVISQLMPKNTRHVYIDLENIKEPQREIKEESF